MILRAQVVLKKLSGLSRDNITNTWHFDCGDAITQDDRGVIASALSQFYTTVLGTYGAAVLDTTAGAHSIRMYDTAFSNVANPNPGITGPPEFVHPFTLSPGGSHLLPAEVAVALTLEANSTAASEQEGGTRPAARRRGRIFLGPIGTTATMVADATTKEVYVAPAFRDAVLGAAGTMSGSLATAVPPIAPVVLSRRDGLGRAVTHYSMDDAFDIIRSRGPRARARVRQVAQTVALGA